MDHQRRQAHLHLHAPRRPQVARRPAGEGCRLRRLAEALDGARRDGAGVPGRHRRDEGHGRQDFHDRPQEALRAAAGRAGEALQQYALHDARARRQHRSQHADHRDHRLGSVQVREGGVGARRQGRLREEHGLCAAQGAAELGRRRQGGEGRQGGMGLHPGFPDRRQRAQRRRGRLVGAGAARPGAAPRQEQGRRGRHHRSARQHGGLALQHRAAAVQQREDAPGGADGGGSEGIHGGGRRRSRSTGRPATPSSPAARRCRMPQAPRRSRASATSPRRRSCEGGGLQGREDRGDERPPTSRSSTRRRW